MAKEKEVKELKEEIELLDDMLSALVELPEARAIIQKLKKIGKVYSFLNFHCNNIDA